MVQSGDRSPQKPTVPYPQRVPISSAAKPEDRDEPHSQQHMLEQAKLRPQLRGWLHAAMIPVAIVSAIILLQLADQTSHRIAIAVFGVSASMLFAVSALFHRGAWGPRAQASLRRLDHANIFLVIAGTYTPYAVLLLPPSSARTLLAVVWTGAALGIAFRVLWLRAPRWVYTPAYILLGWAALIELPAFLAGGRPVALSMAVIGGLFYTVGGVIYGMGRPNPWPRWFGFHEIFHAFTVAAFIVHAIGLGVALRPIAD